MTSFVSKLVLKKILGESRQNKYGQEDPYFETVPASRLKGRPSKKTKRRKKALPPGISDHDGHVLTKVKRRAYRLDMALFEFAGIRFGWGSVIGLVPAVGDVFDTLLALMVLRTCMQIEGGLPSGLRIRMMMNIIFDFVIGLVPFVGDLIDAGFRANTRNAILLESHLREEGVKNLKKAGQPIPATDPSDPAEYDRTRGDASPPGYSSQAPSRQSSRRSQQPTEPPRAEVREGSGRKKSRVPDLEMGQSEENTGRSSRRNGRF
ncbi:hypothetical protein GMORB2_6830 [Geosmithia morbida]|uniref:PH domain-containing protein n=1 Tax=Geosmithia morbida TaxID=1094350 RepID=A0A9P4YWX1_9HYPO|nr:uncharacterized protein GMORB2_6830 [Geosmithia morbida]KAF4123279.1 hypothetical protein GMORB2_6830 [Geosmithia morbida]